MSMIMSCGHDVKEFDEGCFKCIEDEIAAKDAEIDRLRVELAKSMKQVAALEKALKEIAKAYPCVDGSCCGDITEIARKALS